MSELTEIITAVAILTGISTGGLMVFVEWRIGALKDWLATLQNRFDTHIDRRVD